MGPGSNIPGDGSRASPEGRHPHPLRSGPFVRRKGGGRRRGALGEAQTEKPVSVVNVAHHYSETSSGGFLHRDAAQDQEAGAGEDQGVGFDPVRPGHGES